MHYDLTLNDQGYVLTAQETMYNRLARAVAEHLTAAYTCTYDAQGYLTTYHFDRCSYPPSGVKQLTETLNAQLSYQHSNPVTIAFSTKSGQTVRQPFERVEPFVLSTGPDRY